MGDYPLVEYAGLNPKRLFGSQLARLAKELFLPMPMFKGKLMHSDIPAVHRWEILTIILGDPMNPASQVMSYTRVYSTWEKGIDMAMHEAMSRLCDLYFDRLEPTSIFHLFGKRNGEGKAIKTPGDRTNMLVTAKQLEDLEIHAVDMEGLLGMEMKEGDLAKAVIHTQGQELQALHTLRGTMEQRITDLEMEIAAKNAQIAALQAQLHPPPPSDDDDDDDDGDDDDEDGAANAQGNDDEDPDEAMHYPSDYDEDSDEEYAPPMKSTRVTKRKCTRSSVYIKRFKSR